MELSIAKAYFDLPKDVRSQMLAKLKSLLNEESEAAAELTPESSPDDLENLTTEQLEAQYADKQYKKRASGNV